MNSVVRMIKSRRMRWAWHVARMREEEEKKKKNVYRSLVENPERKIPLRLKWEDNVKMILTEMGWCYIDWIDLAQDRGRWRVLLNTVLNLRVP
jgi:hypothetical protein